MSQLESAASVFDPLFSDFVQDIGRLLVDPQFQEIWRQCRNLDQAVSGASASVDFTRHLNEANRYHRFLPATLTEEDAPPEPITETLTRRRQSQLKFLYGAVSKGRKQVYDPLFRSVAPNVLNGGTDLSELRALETAAALHVGGILCALRQGNRRKFVWQIGAGDGSLTALLKSAAPNVTVIVSDSAANFLIAAARIKTSFPNDRCLFLGSDQTTERDLWDRFDTVFVPTSKIDAVTPTRLDLTFSHLALQRMPSDHAAFHVNKAHALGSLFLYDVRLVPVSDEVNGSWPFESLYWPHVMPLHTVLPGEVMHAMDTAVTMGSKNMPDGGVGPSAPQHVIGWRKMTP